jgi:3-phosphoshikimate 1-carboxyvinyltransferase
VPVLAAVALFAAGPTEIYGVAHLRHKESDRLAALASELGRLGGVVEELPDGLRIHPGPAGAAGGLGGLAAGLHGGRVDPNGDHRIAMAGALVGLRVPGVSVADPGCVAKSFPGFWDEIAAGPG